MAHITPVNSLSQLGFLEIEQPALLKRVYLMTDVDEIYQMITTTSVTNTVGLRTS